MVKGRRDRGNVYKVDYRRKTCQLNAKKEKTNKNVVEDPSL